MVYTTADQDARTPTAFPAGLDVHWETDSCVMLNEQERVYEKHELIYEVSWIREIGAWRRFLRSRRKVQN
jgi:hypothetical protein